MPPEVKPIRSISFVRKTREAYLEYARAGIDAVIFDLEDPIPESARERDRRFCREMLEEFGDRPPRIFVRVSDLASGQTLADLQAVLCAPLAGVLLPRVQRPSDVAALDAMITSLEKERGLPAGKLVIDPVLETAAAIRNAYEIALASPRIAYMGGGVSRGGDIVYSLGLRWTESGTESLFIRAKVLLDVRAAEVPYPVCLGTGFREDTPAFRAFAEETRNLGYSGIACTPVQVPFVHQIFTPTAEEIAYWQEIVRVVEAARAGEPAQMSREGLYGRENIHTAHLHTARRGLERARGLGLIAD